MSDNGLDFIIGVDEELDATIMGILVSVGQSMIDTMEKEVSVEIDSPAMVLWMKTDFQFTVIGTVGGFIFNASLDHLDPPLPVTLVMPPFPKTCKLTVSDKTIEDVIETSKLN